VRDDKKECGSPIRSASLSVEDDGRLSVEDDGRLSVEDDKRDWIPHQVRDDGRG